jgi:hypothetical protein
LCLKNLGLKIGLQVGYGAARRVQRHGNGELEKPLAVAPSGGLRAPSKGFIVFFILA